MASGLGMGLPQFSERNCGTTAATRGVVPQLPQSCRTPSLPRKGEGVRRPLRQGFLVGLARQSLTKRFVDRRWVLMGGPYRKGGIQSLMILTQQPRC